MVDITLTKVEKMERISSYVRKWLGAPQSFCTISSLVEEFKCTKVRLEMTLSESWDRSIQMRRTTSNIRMEKGWQAKSSLQHVNIVGHVEQGRGGLGLCQGRTRWKKATPSERRKLVILEVRHQEEAARHAKAVTQAQQGQWANLKRTEKLD